MPVLPTCPTSGSLSLQPVHRPEFSQRRRINGLTAAPNGGACNTVQGGTGQPFSVDDAAEAWRWPGWERPRLVHRLDRDTSGVMVLALNAAAAVLCLENGFVPKISGFKKPDNAVNPSNYVKRNGHNAIIKNALVNVFSPNGMYSSCVIKKYEPSTFD